MKKYDILYVDDEPSNLRVFKDTYRRKYNVHTALSAKEGIRLMQEKSIDLIISDQRMPEMTGVDLLKYSLENYPRINRILITGYSDMDAVENAINHARIFQYIQKPWDESSLTGIIDDALRIYQLEKENAEQKKELKRAKDKAEESDMLKTEFLHNLSHEIRTPLNGIYGFSQLIDSENLTKIEQKQYVKIIKSSSNQLVKTVGDILDFSKLLTKQVKIEKQETSLNQLLSELYSIFELKAKKKNIKFLYEPGLNDKDSFINVDRTKLYIVISNIIDNAFKFTETGFVKIGYDVKGDKIKIYVEDSGIGIHPNNLKFIFERFSQEENYLSNKRGGLGLGLSISQESAKLIDATITLESEKNKGSVFYIEFPHEPSTNDCTTKPVVQEAQNEPKVKILIAEDDEVNLYLLDIMIKKALPPNSVILHALNGKEAIELCHNNKDIDLIFMDIKMPLMDGLEATKQIRDFIKNIPVIAQTAYAEYEDFEKAKNAGCNAIITKPIDKYKLEGILCDYLSGVSV